MTEPPVRFWKLAKASVPSSVPPLVVVMSQVLAELGPDQSVEGTGPAAQGSAVNHPDVRPAAGSRSLVRPAGLDGDGDGRSTAGEVEGISASSAGDHAGHRGGIVEEGEGVGNRSSSQVLSIPAESNSVKRSRVGSR